MTATGLRWSTGFLLVFMFSRLMMTIGETVKDAAKLARRLVDLSTDSIANMATIYPHDHSTLAGQPFSLQEYYANCHENGSLTLLFLPISTHSRNILFSPSHSATISVWSERPAASRARVALIGNVTLFKELDNTPDRDSIQACYIAKHPDARSWLPGPREPHVAYWARFDPQSIYFVGGFGDEHYIGYIPLTLYQSATPEVTVSGLAGRVIIQSDTELRHDELSEWR